MFDDLQRTPYHKIHTHVIHAAEFKLYAIVSLLKKCRSIDRNGSRLL